MKVAIISITRDRLYYNYHCFKSLKEKAGYPYKHIIIDNGSKDGTEKWLVEEGYDPILNKENKGITYAFTQGFERVKNYDLIIKMDSDCELLTENLIYKIVEFYKQGGKYIASPRVQGLHNNLPAKKTYTANGMTFEETNFTGGIFRPMTNKDVRILLGLGSMRDDNVNQWFNQQGHKIGYLPELQVSHYETTDGQHKRYPQYFSNKYLY